MRILIFLLWVGTLSAQSVGLSLGGHNYNNLAQKDGVNVGIYFEQPMQLVFPKEVAPFTLGGQVSITNNAPMYQVWLRTPSKYYAGGALVWYYDLDFYLLVGFAPNLYKFEPRVQLMVSPSGNLITQIRLNYDF